jgi:hypothetical protein
MQDLKETAEISLARHALRNQPRFPYLILEQSLTIRLSSGRLPSVADDLICFYVIVLYYIIHRSYSRFSNFPASVTGPVSNRPFQ